MDIAEIKEIRLGKQDFMSESRKLDAQNCFSLYYGSEFNLKCIRIAGKLNFSF